MSPEEKVDFNFNITEIDWIKSYGGFCYGIRKFFLKEDVPAPELGFRQVLAKQQVDLIHDITFSNNSTMHIKYQNNARYFASILNKDRYKNFV